MQGLWTRYLPASLYVSEIIRIGQIGTVHRIVANTSIAMDPETGFADGTHRMVNAALTGGELLDVGPYSLIWCGWRNAADTQGCGGREEVSDRVDEAMAMLLTFSRDERAGGDLHAVATASMRVSMHPDSKGSVGACVRIQGDKGEI